MKTLLSGALLIFSLNVFAQSHFQVSAYSMLSTGTNKSQMSGFNFGYSPNAWFTLNLGLDKSSHTIETSGYFGGTYSGKYSGLNANVEAVFHNTIGSSHFSWITLVGFRKHLPGSFHYQTDLSTPTYDATGRALYASAGASYAFGDHFALALLPINITNSAYTVQPSNAYSLNQKQTSFSFLHLRLIWSF